MTTAQLDDSDQFGFGWSAELKAWREEVDAFLLSALTPEFRAEMRATGGAPPMAGPLQTAFRKQEAAHGLLGVAVPEEYGGLGKSLLHEWIFLEQSAYRGAPTSDLTESTFTHMFLKHGTEENKRRWLPPITRDEVRVVLGQSEPDAGVDLSRVSTRAEVDGDEFVINGQKIWNSMAHTATHQWLAVRTSGQAPDRAGLSIVMVPMDAPGITIQSLWGWNDNRTNQTFFDDVRVPMDCLVGQPGQGYAYAQELLELEGIKGPRIGGLLRIFEDLVTHCRTTVVDGSLLIDRADTKAALARLDVDLEVARLISLQTTLVTASGKPADVAGAELKVWLTELTSRLADVGMQLLDVAGLLDKRNEAAPLRGKLEDLYRSAPLRAFAGGALEIMRDVVAQRGYGLPGLQTTGYAL